MKNIICFDTETTGVDVFNDRIVQLYIGLYDEQGTEVDHREWLIDPGVPVPEGASDVHGFTTEFLRENGLKPEHALREAWGFLSHATDGGVKDMTFMAYNMNFDLSILGVEFARHKLQGGFVNWVTNNFRLLDPLVVDRAKDKYRKGKRTLEAACAHYGVEFSPDEAHDAGYDVRKTVEVGLKVVAKYGWPTNEEQARWHRSWAMGLQEYLRRSDPDAIVDGDWPYRKGA